MRKTLFQLCISVILLGFFAIQVDWTELLSSFKEINLAFYLASTMAALSGPVILAGKYRLLIKRSNLALPFRRLVTVNFIVRFYALFLPSALGPEAVRWYKITKNKQGKAFFLAATIVERLFFVLVLILFASVPL